MVFHIHCKTGTALPRKCFDSNLLRFFKTTASPMPCAFHSLHLPQQVIQYRRLAGTEHILEAKPPMREADEHSTESCIFPKTTHRIRV